MKNESADLNISEQRGRRLNTPVDPARKAWVWMVFVFLFAVLLPVWPLRGWWSGIPVWGWLAIVSSVFLSGFTAYVILWVWRDPEDEDSRYSHG